MLRWNADFGEKHDYWLAKVRDGQRAPEPFYDRPYLDENEQFYLTAFYDLATERQFGMVVGPIPRSSVRAYAGEFGIHGSELDFFWSVIRQVDSEHARMTRPTKESEPEDADPRRMEMKREMMKKKIVNKQK